MKLVGHLPMELSFLIFAFLKKSSQCEQNASQGNGSRRLENGLVVPRSFQARTTSRAIAAKFEEEIIRLKTMDIKTTVFVMRKYRSFVGY